jgi:hypothetical protein
MSSNDSKIPALQNSFLKLSAEAQSLNSISDQFTKTVGTLDAALKKLNIGLSVWVSYNSWEEGPDYSADQLGYDKVNGTWGIAIRSISGSHVFDEDKVNGPWLFADSPREMRLNAVAYIPELFEALAKKTVSTSEKLRKKKTEVEEMAAALGVSSDEKAQRGRQ